MQAYSDPAREAEPYTLPDVEVFHSDDYPPEDGAEPLEEGWYWWSCSPGCLPDGDPNGPFNTEEEALADAQDGYEMDDNEPTEPQPEDITVQPTGPLESLLLVAVEVVKPA